jgi:ADP-heptose:LPS heptosyltransferase
VITPDTSIVHIARAFDKPMVAVYNKRKLKAASYHHNTYAIRKVMQAFNERFYLMATKILIC